MRIERVRNLAALSFSDPKILAFLVFDHRDVDNIPFGIEPHHQPDVSAVPFAGFGPGQQHR